MKQKTTLLKDSKTLSFFVVTMKSSFIGLRQYEAKIGVFALNENEAKSAALNKVNKCGQKQNELTWLVVSVTSSFSLPE